MSRGIKAIWTKAEVAVLKRAIADRYKIAQIVVMLKLKFSATAVKRKIVAEGILRPRPLKARVIRVLWTDADVETVKACIAEGLTASQCRNRIGDRHSRNSILGMCFKRGLSFGRKPAKHKSKRAHQQNGAKPVPRRTTAAALTRAAIDALPEPVAIGPLNTFPDDSAVVPRQCRAISGDPLNGNWRCCGQPTVPGRAYCRVHAVKFCDPSGAAGKPPPWLVSGGAVAKVFA